MCVRMHSLLLIWTQVASGCGVDIHKVHGH